MLFYRWFEDVISETEVISLGNVPGHRAYLIGLSWGGYQKLWFSSLKSGRPPWDCWKGGQDIEK